MNAYEVSKPLPGSVADEFKFHFGIDQAKVVAQLRKLADAIETSQTAVLGDGNGKFFIEVERVTYETSADREDFTTSKITIILAEKIKP